MRKFKFQTSEGVYTITLKETDWHMATGQIRTAYQLIAPDNRAIFSGDDLGCAPSDKPESKANAIALLAFLTLKPGDTDADYFEKYTPEQLTWCEGNAAEELSWQVSDYEERQSKRR